VQPHQPPGSTSHLAAPATLPPTSNPAACTTTGQAAPWEAAHTCTRHASCITWLAGIRPHTSRSPLRPRGPDLQEEKAQTDIAALKAEVVHLNKLIEQGGNLSVAEERTLAGLMAQKEEVARERDGQVGGWAAALAGTTMPATNAGR
jgi:hypothetical protein